MLIAASYGGLRTGELTVYSARCECGLMEDHFGDDGTKRSAVRGWNQWARGQSSKGANPSAGNGASAKPTETIREPANAKQVQRDPKLPEPKADDLMYAYEQAADFLDAEEWPEDDGGAQVAAYREVAKRLRRTVARMNSTLARKEQMEQAPA